MSTKQFHIGDVVSITEGSLMSPRHMEGVYDILNFMTGESLFTHQLPIAARECTPELLRQHPQLAGLHLSVTPANFESELAKLVATFGEMLEVTPLAESEPQYDTPVADAIEMMGDATKVVVMEP